jgi:hypothetical protein
VSRRKYLLYGLGAAVLVLTVLYFVRQFNALTQDRPLGLAPPSARKDSIRPRQAGALTRLYEQEEKNRYQDSISLAREEKALDYIVMDWENLYDVKKRQAQAEPEKVHSADSTGPAAPAAQGPRFRPDQQPCGKTRCQSSGSKAKSGPNQTGRKEATAAGVCFVPGRSFQYVRAA